MNPENDHVALLTLPGGALTPLQTEGTYALEAVVSPSGKYIALRNVSVETFKTQWLEIRDHSGILIRKARWPENWLTLSGWLDDDQIVVQQQEETQSEHTLGYHYVVIDRRSGETIDAILPPPEVYTLPPLPNWQFWQTYVPDRSREFAAFLREVDGVAWTYSLWSYKSNSLLMETRTFNNLVKPEWSPTATEVAMAYSDVNGGSSVSDEIYVVDSDGRIQRLTRLHDVYQTSFIQSLRWSLQGEKLAFWLNSGMNKASISDNYGPQTLMVLDRTSHQVADLCVEGDANTVRIHKTIPAPFWSADGSYLLVENRKSESDSRLLVVEAKDGHAYQVGAQLTPLGWMTAP